MSFGDRRTALKRKTELRADPAKTREWQARSRQALPEKSEKQKQIDKRRRVIKRAKLLDVGLDVMPGYHERGLLRRACAGAEAWPEIACMSWSHERPSLELHEVVKRSRWRMGAVDPENSVLLCQAHHDATESDPTEATRRGLLASADHSPGV